MKLADALHAQWLTAPLSAFRVCLLLKRWESRADLQIKLDLSISNVNYIVRKLESMGWVEYRFEIGESNYAVKVFRLKPEYRQIK